MGTVSVFNHAALSYPYIIRDHDVKMSSGLDICKHLPRIKYSSSLVLREPRALMNEAGLGNEGSLQEVQRGCKGLSQPGHGGSSFQGESQPQEAGITNKRHMLLCSQVCGLLSYDVLYPHCFMHCPHDISSSVLPADYIQGPLCGLLLDTAFAWLLCIHMYRIAWIAWANTEATYSFQSGDCGPATCSGLPL